MHEDMDVDTPHIPPTCPSKQVVSAPILLGNKIDDSRDALLSDIGPAVPQVTIQWFKDSIMPPLPAGLDMPAVIKRLKAEKCITPDGVLAQFTTVPANARDHEDDVFKPLTSLAANMGNIAEEFLGEKPTVLFQCNPTRAPESRRKNSTRPDGYGRYTAHPCHKKSNRQVFWAEIVAPGEFKKVKNAKNTNDNIAKILWSFNHILREDPCRRFVIGFTIENTEMRLWFGSRTDVLVTEAFDFTRDHTTLAHFFLSQMYAKDDELGYDPTMKLAKDQTKYKNQYDITIHHLALGSGGADSDSIDVSKTKPVVLRTEKLISDIGAEALRSRGTRVWHARVLTGELKGTLMVIKDYWVDHDRLREPEIRARILADAQTEEDKATLEQHLLTPQYFGDVVIRGKRDNTLTLLRRGAVVPTDMTYLTIHDSGSGLLSDILEDRPGAPLGTGTIMAAPPQTPKPILFHDKSHTRIAFLERAVTIDNIRSLGFVFTIAVETVKALRALHKSGWVHRDISAGNLLIVAGVVKISDLEYAKRMDDPTTHEHGRSPGTPMFQSVEAEAHRYRFLPRQLKPPGPSSKGKKPKPVVLPPPFRYNPLHDLESLWWLLVWLLLVRKADIDGDTEQRRYDQHAFYHRLYTSQRFRWEAFNDSNVFDYGSQTLHPKLEPVGRVLENVRNNLVWTYVEAEETDPIAIGHDVGDDIVEFIIHDFEEVAGQFQGYSDIQFLKGVKVRRKRTPEQPGPAVVYGTSLDSRVEGRSNKRGYHAIADSTVVDNDALWKAADDVKVKRVKQDEEEREKEAANAHGDGVGVAAKGNGENRGRSRSKGKGKGRARAA